MTLATVLNSFRLWEPKQRGKMYVARAPKLNLKLNILYSIHPIISLNFLFGILKKKCEGTEEKHGGKMRSSTNAKALATLGRYLNRKQDVHLPFSSVSFSPILRLLLNNDFFTILYCLHLRSHLARVGRECAPSILRGTHKRRERRQQLAFQILSSIGVHSCTAALVFNLFFPIFVFVFSGPFSTHYKIASSTL